MGAALLLRGLLNPILEDTLPFVTLFGAVAFAVWTGGSGPAIVAAAIGYGASLYFFIAPQGEARWTGPADAVGFVAYAFTCALIILLGQVARTAQRQMQQRQQLLQVTLQSIGDAAITTDPEGRVASMNAVAEQLTGWSQSEALDRPLD